MTPAELLATVRADFAANRPSDALDALADTLDDWCLAGEYSTAQSLLEAVEAQVGTLPASVPLLCLQIALLYPALHADRHRLAIAIQHLTAQGNELG